MIKVSVNFAVIFTIFREGYLVDSVTIDSLVRKPRWTSCKWKLLTRKRKLVINFELYREISLTP